MERGVNPVPPEQGQVPPQILFSRGINISTSTTPHRRVYPGVADGDARQMAVARPTNGKASKHCEDLSESGALAAFPCAGFERRPNPTTCQEDHAGNGDGDGDGDEDGSSGRPFAVLGIGSGSEVAALLLPGTPEPPPPPPPQTLRSFSSP
ncbi:unnamed protein product [Diplocarpon coronariae]